MPIEEKFDAKYLGVILDNKLIYDEHIKHVKSKLIKGNAILAKVRHFIPTDLLTNTYFAHLQSHIDYGLNLWGYATQNHLDNIISLQKKALRIMCFKKAREESQPLFASKNILNFQQNVKLQAGKMLWKASNSFLCPSLRPLFNKRPDDSNSFHTPHRRLDVSQNCLTYAGVRTWNSIPAEIRASSSLDSFKRNYKEHLISGSNGNQNNNVNNTLIRFNRPWISRWSLEI